jgi:endonuclease III
MTTNGGTSVGAERGRDGQRRRALRLYAALAREYPDAHCELRHANPFQLLAATILSAQCTDERVNQVTPELFRRLPTPAAMAEAAPEDVEMLVRSTGFYRNKARALREASRGIVDRYGGKVPRTMVELLTLHGVARKTANVVLGTAFARQEGVVVDTHVLRLSRRLGLSRQTNPVKVEADLMKLFPRESWTQLSHLLIWHGRRRCFARNPDCGGCPLRKACPRIGLPPWPPGRVRRA